MKTIEAIDKKLSYALEWFTEICFVLMFLSTVYQIVSRSILKVPSTWTDEFSRFMYVWITFVGAVITTLNREHIRVEILYDRMSARVQIWLDIASNVIAIVFCLIAARGGMTLVKLNGGAYFSSLPRTLTYALIYWPIPISMIGMALVLGLRTVLGLGKAFGLGGKDHG